MRAVVLSPLCVSSNLTNSVSLMAFNQYMQITSETYYILNSLIYSRKRQAMYEDCLAWGQKGGRGVSISTVMIPLDMAILCENNALDASYKQSFGGHFILMWACTVVPTILVSLLEDSLTKQVSIFVFVKGCMSWSLWNSQVELMHWDAAGFRHHQDLMYTCTTGSQLSA